MSKEIALKNNNLDMLAALRNTVAPGLNDSEFLLFSEMCKATGLNPATKEIWAIKTSGRLQLMTGINGFLRIANSHPQFDGMEVSFEWDGKQLVSCTVKVHRKDRKFPSVATAYWSEYAKQTPIWRSMPTVMLSKCAKSLAIREAFINELGGLYTQEEMPPEFAPPKANTLPDDCYIVSEKTGRVIGLDLEATRIANSKNPPEALPEAKGDALSGQIEASLAEFEATEESGGVFYDLSSATGDTFKAAELYLANANAKNISGNLWLSKRPLAKLIRFKTEVKDVRE